MSIYVRLYDEVMIKLGYENDKKKFIIQNLSQFGCTEFSEPSKSTGLCNEMMFVGDSTKQIMKDVS